MPAVPTALNGCVSTKAEKWNICPHAGCGRGFLSISGYKSHLKGHTESEDSDDSSGSERFTCEACGKQYRSRSGYDKHVSYHHGNSTLACDELGCGKFFPSFQALRAHKLRLHGQAEKPLPFLCSFPGCNRRFNRLGNQRRHEQKSHNLIISDGNETCYVDFSSESVADESYSSESLPKKVCLAAKVQPEATPDWNREVITSDSWLESADSYMLSSDVLTISESMFGGMGGHQDDHILDMALSSLGYKFDGIEANSFMSTFAMTMEVA